MEILTSFFAAAVTEISRSFCKCICPKIKSTVRFKVNLQDLEKEKNKLMDLMKDIKQQLESAKKIERSATTEVKSWLRDADEFLAKVNSAQAGATINDERLSGCLCHCSQRIRLGSKVGILLKEVDKLLKAGSFPDGVVSINDSAKAVEYIPGPPIEYQTTASRNLAELMKMLEDSNIQKIGVWGMGGVGKTTLVKNLNNKLNRTCSNQPFSIVIWITVSKDLDMKRLQKQIAERLNLGVAMEESIERMAGRLHQMLEKEKFLLILDDVWDDIDLDCLGIPQPEIHSSSKILLTSRFFDVCQRMMTDVEVKVNTLNDEEAWQLFSRKAGEITSSEHIEPIAKAVARECCGLPLALITVGTAMRGKKKVELWKHALKELQRSVPCISGVKDKVYNSLKLSYDSLENNNIRACFLYCALYPEDFSIEVRELLQCWLAEGLIDDQQNFEEIVNNGVFVVETLKDACLLDDGSCVGTVKMHDVVRDVAIWIASSPEENDFRSQVRSGIGLNEIPEVDLLEDSVKRVSFMYNRIHRVTCSATQQCSKASTLLLQDNPLEEVPDMFLQSFRALKVLNVSRTGIKSLPPLLQLGELRAFLMQRCFNIRRLPPLGVLTKLQVLDISGTHITELPKEMENLINLRQVNLSCTHYLHRIRAGIVSKWTRLEFLDMTASFYHWRTRGNVREGEATLEEILSLEHLSCLSLVLESVSCLDPENLSTRIGRIRRFQFSLSSNRRPVFTSGRHEKGKVTLNWHEKSIWGPEMIGWLLVNATSLVCNGGKDLNFIIQGLLSVKSVGSSTLDCFAALKSLTINNIHRDNLFPAKGSDDPDFLPNLEELVLMDITCGIESISELVDHLGLKLYKLKTILVLQCPHLKNLFSSGHFCRQMPNLELITVKSCLMLETLFECNFALPNLRILILKDLRKLRYLCIPGESWPRLEKVYVFQCYRLRSLPLSIANARTIQEIRGELQWWSELIWGDEETKSSLQPYYNTMELGRFSMYAEGFELEDTYSFIRRCYTPESP